MADYSSNMEGSGGSAQRTRGYQATRRQDRDRREKRKELLNSGSQNQDDSSLSEQPTKSESCVDHKDDTVKHSEKIPGRSATRSNDSYDGFERYNSGKTKTPYKENTRQQYSYRDSRDIKSREGRDRDFRDYRDKERRSHDYKDTRKYDRDMKDKRAPSGESAREFKFKKDLSGKNDPVKSPPKKQPETETKNDSGNLMDILSQSKGQSRVKNRGKDGKLVTASDLEAQWQKEESEKQRKEEEEKKLREEEERKKQEEERKIREAQEKKEQEEAEAKRLLEEEKAHIEGFAKECEERLTMKKQCRQTNLNASENRPDESSYSKLDSSLKKNTAFVKKLKNLTESQEESLLKDIRSLNLTKYIGEVAAAFTEAKLKMSDIPCALRLCSTLHQRYADFSGAMLEHWNKILLTKKDDKVQNPSKLRVDLRFFADLITVGVFSEKEAMGLLSNQLVLLIRGDMREHNNLSILISFCKHCGDDYAGLIPTKYQLLAEKYAVEIRRSSFLKQERQQACRKLLKEYHTSIYKRLPDANNELQALERTNHNILMTKGELSEERRQRQEAAQQAFQKLLTNASTYADLVNEGMPVLRQQQVKPDDVMGINVFSPGDSQHVYEGESALFEDEDTRQFYEHLPDLKAVVPQILYKDSEASTEAPAAAEEETSQAELDAEINVEDLERELTEVTSEADVSKEEEVAPVEAEEEDFDIAGSMKLILEEFLTSLPNCVSRELIDKAASDFCMNLNTKANRKKLSRGLFSVHRTRYDLLPFYGRLVATLHPCMPDVALELNTLLKTDFKWHVRKKDQINIESKLKVVRFIGELCKFNMFPKADVLHCVKMLLFDFSHHNIEMACALLDTCGRFLYRSHDSHHMTKVFLEVMLRKKNALHLDGRYNTMIENAFYYCNPPEYKREEQKPRPPVHQYIRRLLYRDLNKITTEKILRQLRKLDWDDADLAAYTTKCLISVWHVRYNVIHCCANLLAGLAPYHEHVAIAVIDGILEDIRMGLELNLPKLNQRRMSCVKYVGELYNYRMVESSVIFKTLYAFITFGVFLQDDVVSVYDPPEHLFRIRLVCSLLDTCGQYFDRGSSKKKLDCFLVYFQRYYWLKRVHPRWTDELPFPIEVEYSYIDTLQFLRPKLPLASSFEDACAKVDSMEQELRAKLANVLPKTELSGETDDQSLTTIQESEEMDELADDLSQVRLTEGSDPTGESGEGQSGLTGEPRGSQSQDSEVQQSDSEEHTQRTDSQSQSQRERTEDGEEDLDESSHDDDSDSVTSQRHDEHDDPVIAGGPRHIECQEDEDFMAAFDKMLTDTVQARSSESVKTTQLDIAVPMHVRSHKHKYQHPGSEEVKVQTPITFTLMTRRGNKQHFSNLDVPVSDQLAASYRQREEAEKAEKERLKRMVLDIHERQEEEDYQEMLDSLNRCTGSSSGAGNPNLNRERRVRYQHPKGAPDADLIFGSKKR